MIYGQQNQEFIPGNTYFGSSGFIEYQPGNLPLIISVPHGGYISPDSIPDRNCVDCAYVQDAYTQELARLIIAAFQQNTGCKPHVIFNLLHRKKLDMNRDSIMAADSNAALYIYWNEYHNFIKAAKKKITDSYGKGLFIDLHGHGHTKQRIEYGYLLYDSELRESDSMLNTPKRISISSIEYLAGNNASGSTHAQLLRGKYALGTILATKGYPGVPSMQDPFPLENDAYFNGGYNTFYHGSSPGGSIDAIQMELYSAIRFDSVKRAAFAKSLAASSLDFLDKHYFPGFSANPCGINSVNSEPENNPVIEYYSAGNILHIYPRLHGNFHMEIRDILGKLCLQSSIPENGSIIPVHILTNGMYMLTLQDQNAVYQYCAPLMIY